MPLDNAVSIKDIITALQTMEGINAKADLASVIGSPATADDTMATLVSLIQQSKNALATKMNDGSTGAEPLRMLVNRLFVGKKWASGVAQLGLAFSFQNINGGNASGKAMTITGIDFKPSRIIAWNIPNYYTIFESIYYAPDSTSLVYKNGFVIGHRHGESGGQTGGFTVKADTNPWSITSEGFTIPFHIDATGDVIWVAYE